METINSIASSASKAIWGESTDNNNNNTTTSTSTTNTVPVFENQKPITDDTTSTTTTDNAAKMSAINETRGQEPISGQLGDTSKGEPFDAGNIEPGTTAHSTGATDSVAQSDVPATESTTSAIGATGDSVQSNVPTTETSTTTGTTGDAVQSRGPTTEHPSTTGDTGFKAAQADVRDPDTNPTADPKKEEERKNVDDTGALDESENPGKVDGPGPRPIDEVARERGGDAGKNPDGSSGGAAAAKDNAEEPEGTSSENKGSGEQYVKSSGLQADGGDFDATKPGAGREADRLLEEKGISNPATAAAAGKKSEDQTDAPGSPDTKEKKSLKDKIKAKLHKN